MQVRRCRCCRAQACHRQLAGSCGSLVCTAALKAAMPVHSLSASSLTCLASSVDTCRAPHPRSCGSLFTRQWLCWATPMNLLLLVFLKYTWQPTASPRCLCMPAAGHCQPGPCHLPHRPVDPRRRWDTCLQRHVELPCTPAWCQAALEVVCWVCIDATFEVASCSFLCVCHLADGGFPLAASMLTGALALGGFQAAGYGSNHQDLSPKYSGILFG